MFLHEDDIEALRLLETPHKEEDYVVIFDEKEDSQEIALPTREIVQPQHSNLPDFSKLYDDSQKIIIKKDEIIQDLSYRLWKTETELKNSIPLVEYKKATFLLESAKNKTDSDAETLGTKISSLEKEISKRNSAILGLAILFVLVLAFSIVFFLYTQLALKS